MIRKEDIIADLHTHTIFSGHAYSTVKENIDVARENGIKYLAITDHYNNDGTDLDKKNEIARIAYVEEVNLAEDDITVIGGAEFNIGQEVNYNSKLSKIRWRPIGLHNWYVDTKNLTLDELYMHFYRAIKNNHNAFAHIERELHKIDGGKHKEVDSEVSMFLKMMVDIAKEKDILLELNESSLIADECNGVNRVLFWLRYAKENGNLIYLGTDAHYCKKVGIFTNAIDILNMVGYPKELILNCNEELLKEKLNLR